MYGWSGASFFDIFPLDIFTFDVCQVNGLRNTPTVDYIWARKPEIRFPDQAAKKHHKYIFSDFWDLGNP
jgi:hypothetical protein